MEHRVGINLFGQFEVRLDGFPVRMPTRKVELILALLAIEPDVALSRSTLAGMLWPGQPDAQARASLRQAIFRLKTSLEPSDALEVTSGWIKLRSDRLERDLDAAGHGGAVSALPMGTPLEGMSGFEPEVEDRLDAARAELRARLMGWLEEAESEALAARRFADLERLARRHLMLDGYDESALRMLMTALWRQGRRNAALDVFRETSKRIRADLSVSVDPSTTALYQEIRAQPAASENQKRTAVSTEKAGPPASLASPPAEATLPHLRHVAVMHVVSDRLLAALRNRDPEDAEAASRAASDAIERAVRREGGLIAGRAGHRLSCVFGVDRPDESPALSAALAAFEVARLDCAVGIDASRGLIGGEIDSYPAAHLAQMLAEAAAPRDALCTDRVAASCCGAFSFTAAEFAQAGEAEPLSVWRLTGEILSRGSFDIRKARGLTPFVARESEIDEVSALAAQSGPRAVAITGEAGIGKSRFVHETLMRLGPVQLLRVQFHPNEVGGGIARFASVLASLLGDRVVDDPGAALDAAIPDAALRRRIAPVEALFAARGAAPESVEMPRGVRLQAIADALLLAMQVLAGRNSILLVEDAHWADDDGALLVERILRSLDGDGPLVIVTMRPSSGLNLSGIAGLRSMTLAPLSEAEAVRLLALLGRDATGDITARSGGVPLFLEEIARLGTMPEDGSQPVPETLAGLLTRRIDALPPHLRRTIEAAAVLGAEPADDLLQPLSGLRPDAYEAAITQLADGDLLFRLRSVPQRVYGFKHALVQEAAYQAIPTRRRRDLHATVVELRENAWRAGEKSTSAMLAHHAAASDQPVKAVEFALSATEDAVARSAYPLAEAMLGLALDEVGKLPPSPAARRTEALILKRRRPMSWLMSKGDIEQGLERSETLAAELGDDQLLAEVCVNRAYLHSDDGQISKALRYCRLAEEAACRAGILELSAEASLARCQVRSLHGHMLEALRAAEPCLNTWDDRRGHRGEFIVTRFVMLQFLLARSQAALGDGARALTHLRDGAEASLETGRPVDRYIALRAVAEAMAFAGNQPLSAHAFETTHTLATEAGLASYASWSEAELLMLELDAHPNAPLELCDRLKHIARTSLFPVARLKAMATAACANAETGVAEMRALLLDAESLDLPLIELRLLEELVHRGGEDAADLRRRMHEVHRARAYARCSVPELAALELIRALA
ncbi:AAA family ATPase [Pseudooceanicola nanhaiensis]|uniref:AAA family ATPase n=1 Tax=Pseudooceanicola nanhaiensis TaxID=375761 RepID=UPI0040599DB7